jgi:hypothetical protein
VTSTSISFESTSATFTPLFSAACTMAFSSHLITSYSRANEGVLYSPQSSCSFADGFSVTSPEVSSFLTS